MFTDKSKEKFEEWYFKKHVITEMEYNELLPHHKKDIYEWFYNLDISFQFGVIEDFGDTLGYCINLTPIRNIISGYVDRYAFIIEIRDESEKYNKKQLSFGCHNTRTEARLECIKALNELLNK